MATWVLLLHSHMGVSPVEVCITYVEGDVFDDQVDTVDDTNDCEGANS